MLSLADLDSERGYGGDMRWTRVPGGQYVSSPGVRSPHQSSRTTFGGPSYKFPQFMTGCSIKPILSVCWTMRFFGEVAFGPTWGEPRGHFLPGRLTFVLNAAEVIGGEPHLRLMRPVMTEMRTLAPSNWSTCLASRQG